MKESRVSRAARGIPRRILAAVLTLALCICGLPLAAENAQTEAATTGSAYSWESWEDLYNAMEESAEEYGFKSWTYKLSNANDYENFWSTLVEIMDELDIADAETDYEKVYAIINWIGENVYYSTEGNHGNAGYILENGHGACEGCASLFYIMCAYAGVDATIVTNATINHAWNAVRVDGGWYWVDVTPSRTTSTLTATQILNTLVGNDSIEGDVSKYIKSTGYPNVCSLISDYGYGYYNTSCKGEHNFEINGWKNAGSNYGCDPGYIYYVCADCGYATREIVESDTGHSYETVVVDPTCIDDGYTYYVCSACGEYYTEDCYTWQFDITDALGHLESDTDDLIITKEPTCTTTGTGYTYCTRCMELGVENGGGTYKMTKVTIPATGHTYDDGVITTAATAASAGVKTYTCQTCGATKTETIAATGGSLADAAVVLEYDTCTYDGTSHFPEVTVYMDGVEVNNTVTSTTTTSTTKVLTGTMYTVTYRTGAAYKAAGQVPVVISAGTNGLLTDDITVYFTIEKADTTVTASIDSSAVPIGDTAQITASAAVDTTGTSRTVYYSSSDTSVATVSSSGLVTGVAAGVAVITVYTAANASYYNQGYAYITVVVTDEGGLDISGASVIFGEAKSFYVYDGTAKEPGLCVMLGDSELTAGSDYQTAYTDNVNAGTATVTIAGTGSYSGSVTASFTITQADLSDASVTLSADSCAYDGTAKEPEVAVTLDGTTLTKGTDYTVSYSNNTDIGTASVTVTGCGNYTGTAEASFAITAAGLSGASVSLSANEYTYDGTAHTPSVAVTLNGTALTEGTDYSVSYGNNTNAGTATVTVTGVGNYTGTCTGKFVIAKAEAEVSADDVTVTCGSTAAILAASTSGGTLSFVSSDTSVATVSSSGTVTGVSAGTATVTVTAAATDNYYSAETEIAVTVDAIDFSGASVTLSGTSYTYDGTAHTPSVTVTLDGTTLVSGTDYLVSYSDNVCVGTATVTVMGTGCYSGLVTVEFTITESDYEPADIGSATVTPDTASYTYDGTAKEPGVTVTLDGKTLTEGTDYSVSYSNNTNAGTATVTVTGCGNYTGTAAGSFTINKAVQAITLSNSYVSLKAGKSATVTASASGGGEITWASADTSVATVSSSGKVTGVSYGSTTITASAAATDNYNAASITISVSVSRNSQSITVGSSSVTLAVGKTGTISVSGNETALSYASSDTSVATVSSSGKITAKKVGTATVTVTAAQTGTYAKATATVTVKVKPAAAAISSVTNTTSGVKVKWDKVTGATGYYIYRKVSGGSYSKVGTVTSGSTVSWTDTSVSSGKTYSYKVYAYASTGTASASSAKTIRYLKAGKISSLTNTSSGITVKWSKVTGASGYYVYRKAGSGSYSKVKTITSASTVSWTDTAVKSKNGTAYTYKVVPYYKSGSTSYTGSFTAKKTVRLTGVSLSSVTNSSSKKMTVKWAKNSSATGYQIQYSTSSTFASGNKTVTVSGASTVKQVISSLTGNKTYYVRIRAYKTVSGTKYYSAWSSKKSVKISK